MDASPDHGLYVKYIAVCLVWIGGVTPFVGGEGFEFYGCLAFVKDFVVEAEEGGDGVEEAAQAGGGRAVDASLDHLGQWAPLGRVEAAGERGVEVEEAIAVGTGQVDGGHAPGLADGLLAAGQGHVGEMGHALEAPEIRKHDLATPDGPVGAVARAVGGYADHGAFQVVLCYDTRYVGMMVLDPDFVWDVEVEGVFGGEVFGVEVVGDGLGVDVEQALVVLDALAEGGEGFEVLQVADVVADECLAAFAEGEGFFKVTAASQ